MANRAFPYTPELAPFQAADDAWGEELRRVFGREACNARYLPQGRGEEGSRLRELYIARDAARVAWRNSAYSHNSATGLDCVSAGAVRKR